MTIRSGDPDDVNACIELWLAALESRDGTSPDAPVAARARAKFDRALVRFAVIGAQPLAFALTVETDHGDATAPRKGGTATLELLAVAPLEAGRGLGRALVADAVQRTTELGFSAIDLHVREGNDHARKLYVSSSFEKRGDPMPHPLGGPPMIAYTRLLQPWPLVGAT